MNDTQKRRVDALTSFCGYGNPETAKIFFMGIEEHNTLGCDGNTETLDVDAFIEGLSHLGTQSQITYKDISDGTVDSAKGVTERMHCRIYRILFDDKTTESSEIFKHKIHCFNLYPLGANKQEHYPSHYNECFGFDFKEKDQLYKYFERDSNRNDILKSFVNKHVIERGKLLFVLGTSNWPKAVALLECKFSKPFDEFRRKHGRPSAIKWSPNKQIWLTGHPSHGWINEEVIKKIAVIRGSNP